MRVDKWDIMMHRLLTEQKDARVIAEKRFAGKKELDKDGDGVPKWADKDDEDPKVGSQKSSKKKGGKVPPQLKMHIKKKKKSKLDEAIAYLEKILIENLDEEQADAALQEYGEERYPHPAEEDLDDDDMDWDSEEDELEYSDDDGDEDWGDESYESEDISAEDSDGFDDFMEEGVEYLSEAEVKKKKPRLGKVTRNPSGSKKKFHVYVKCGGRVKKISFGDPGLSIKRDSPARRKNFRARHKCDKPAGKDRCTARYWSCYQWRAGKKVEGE
jgi:hypothetical protein